MDFRFSAPRSFAEPQFADRQNVKIQIVVDMNVTDSTNPNLI
jgi:hypothetical protein